MQIKKILLSITNLTGGGAEKVVSVWANELSERGFDVTLLLAGRVNNEYPLLDSVKVVTVAPIYDEYKTYSGFQKYSLRRKLIKKLNPDYIISFLSQNRIWTYLCAWGLHAKRIETMRISPWHANGMNGISGKLTNRCFQKCYKLILQSSDQAPYFSEKIQKKSVVIPNPISKIYETHYKKEISETVHIFIAAGRLTEQKNYNMMIDAFAIALNQMQEVDKPILRIFGAEDSPGYTEKLRMHIQEKEMEDHILLMGRSSHIEDDYANADVFLMSSDFEGMPNALAEAMASRLVCISTDCKTGPRDLIDDGQNGYLVPVGDAQAMAEAILKVCQKTKDDRIKISDNARNKIMTYCSKENSSSKLCSLLEK